MRSNPLSGEVLYHDSVSVIGSEIHVLAEVSMNAVLPFLCLHF